MSATLHAIKNAATTTIKTRRRGLSNDEPKERTQGRGPGRTRPREDDVETVSEASRRTDRNAGSDLLRWSDGDQYRRRGVRSSRLGHDVEG